MPPIQVVCGIIFHQDKVFICRRNTTKSLVGYWEFPGGKIETGEQAEESLLRELKEELDMQVTILQPFMTVTHSYDNTTIELRSYICQFENATYTLTDHDLYEWVYPSELLQKQLAPADIPLAIALNE